MRSRGARPEPAGDPAARGPQRFSGRSSRSGVNLGRYDRVAPTARGIEEVIGDCAVYEDGCRRPGRLPLDQVGTEARATEGFVWIGLQQPTAAEIAVVAVELGLPALAVEDAVNSHQRPKLEVYDGVVFAVLKPARYVDHVDLVDVSELAIFIGPRFVVTVRHGDSSVLRQVRSELDAGSGLLVHGPAAVLYRAADLVVDGYEEAIEHITEDVDEIEALVFGDAEIGHAERIYKLKREVVEFRRAVLPLAGPLQRLADRSVPGIGEELGPYFRDVHDHLLRATDAIEGHDRLLTDVLSADLSRLGARHSQIAVRQNEDMRKISAWAAIALLPTAVAGIYGMNFDHMPELRWRYGYFIVIGFIAVACALLHRSFRKNGWL
jgi:magnesium transporter